MPRTRLTLVTPDGEKSFGRSHLYFRRLRRVIRQSWKSTDLIVGVLVGATISLILFLFLELIEPGKPLSASITMVLVSGCLLGMWRHRRIRTVILGGAFAALWLTPFVMTGEMYFPLSMTDVVWISGAFTLALLVGKFFGCLRHVDEMVQTAPDFDESA